MFKRYLPKSRFGRNVIVLAGGTAVAQGILILVSPILTRIYSPEDFGVWAVYTSIVSIVLVLASLRYEFAIPLPKREGDAFALLVLALGIVVVISLIFSAAVSILGEFFVDLLNVPVLGRYLWVFPLGLLGAGIYQVLNYWAIRENEFGLIARTRFTRSVGQVITQLVLGILQAGPLGLLLGHVVGQAGGSEVLIFSVLKRYWKSIRATSWDRVKQVAYRYRRFPLISSGASLLNIVSSQVAILLLLAFYGSQVAGWLSLVTKVIGLPLTLVGSAVAQTYLGESSIVLRDGEGLYGLFSRTARRLFFLGSIPIALLGISSPLVFPFVFGGDWQNAGFYALVMTPMFMAQFVVSPLSQSANVVERQDLQFLGDALRLIIVVAVFLVAHFLKWSHFAAIAAYSGSMFLTYLIFFFLYRFAVKLTLNNGKQ